MNPGQQTAGTQTQQNQQGAILLSWEGAQPGQIHAAPVVLQQSIRYMDQLRTNGDITSHREYVNVTDSGGFAVLEGQIDRLIDLVKDVDYRQWLMTLQSVLTRFKAITSLGGTDGQVEAVLAQQQEAHREVQNSRQLQDQIAQSAGSFQQPSTSRRFSMTNT